MQFGGKYEVAMERKALWDRLHDPAVLAACLPGCESLERLDDGSMKATIVTKLGPIRARFVSRLQIEDLEEFSSYRLTGTGDGGPTGSAKGQATITLRDGAAMATTLTYEASVAVTGRLAQIGGRLLQGTAESFAADFFARMVPAAAPVVEVAEAPAATVPLFARSGVRITAAALLLLLLLLVAYLLAR
jgi:carbon monoxide dehydrogenase subunit G